MNAHIIRSLNIEVGTCFICDSYRYKVEVTSILLDQDEIVYTKTAPTGAFIANGKRMNIRVLEQMICSNFWQFVDASGNVSDEMCFDREQPHGDYEHAFDEIRRMLGY